MCIVGIFMIIYGGCKYHHYILKKRYEMSFKNGQSAALVIRTTPLKGSGLVVNMQVDSIPRGSPIIVRRSLVRESTTTDEIGTVTVTY